MEIVLHVWKDVAALCQAEVDAPGEFFTTNGEGAPTISNMEGFIAWASDWVRKGIDGLRFEPEWECGSGERISGVDLDADGRIQEDCAVELDIPLSENFWSAGLDMQEMKRPFGKDVPLARMEEAVFSSFTRACRRVGIAAEEQDAIISALSNHRNAVRQSGRAKE